MIALKKIISEEEPKVQKQLEEVKKATSLCMMIMAAWKLGQILMVMLVEEILAQRAKEKTEWPNCEKCGTRLQSKGFAERQIVCILGKIRWERRVGRCPKGCKIGQVAPLDEELEIKPYQQTSVEVKKIGSTLAVFVAYETAASLMKQIIGIEVSSSTIWQWVQISGKQAMEWLEKEIVEMAQGQMPKAEQIEEIAQLPIIMGADGVMVGFRPNGGSPKGKTIWAEVKIAIIARLKKQTNRVGQIVERLTQRRLVAVLGNIDDLGKALTLEAHKQAITQASTVVWLSDGARGLWRLFAENFSHLAIGVLDFYHSSQNLWKAISVCLDAESLEAKELFISSRHKLRHGEQNQVLADIAQALELDGLPDSAKQSLMNLYLYLDKHKDHIQYQHFKEMGLPIGSGLVESACKWLIQQRFKGVGMRWSQNGFNHLLHLRLAWVNGRFDSFFPFHKSSPYP
jgi:hypothetical protein